MSYTPGSEGTTLATVTYVDGQPTLTSAHPIEGTYGPNGEINVTVEPVTVDGQQVECIVLGVDCNLSVSTVWNCHVHACDVVLEIQAGQRGRVDSTFACQVGSSRSNLTAAQVSKSIIACPPLLA